MFIFEVFLEGSERRLQVLTVQWIPAFSNCRIRELRGLHVFREFRELLLVYGHPSWVMVRCLCTRVPVLALITAGFLEALTGRNHSFGSGGLALLVAGAFFTGAFFTGVFSVALPYHCTEC